MRILAILLVSMRDGAMDFVMLRLTLVPVLGGIGTRACDGEAGGGEEGAEGGFHFGVALLGSGLWHVWMCSSRENLRLLVVAVYWVLV